MKDVLNDKDTLFGLVLNLEEDIVKAVVLGDPREVYEGMTVKSTGRVLSVPASYGLLGRVVNPLGEPKDGLSEISHDKYQLIERKAYGVMDRSPVNTPIHTGIKAIDSMIPIGRGQRELIIGDRHTGKTAIALDTIINQLSEPEEKRPICIYVAIGQKESKIARLVAELKEKGALKYTIVVSASASDPAVMQFLAPFSGVAIGEYFMEKGKDVLIVYDDLSKHAVAYRQISLLLRRPPGREAYPGDIFYLHSRLLERSAKLNDKLLGGSITALPIIETQEGDVSAYIPTNVISITDGQIFLNNELFNKNIRPAIDVGISVSRVGSSAQTKAMKKVSGKIRLELAQFREMEAFVQFAQDLDPETKAKIEKGKRLVEALRQKNKSPLSFEKEVIAVYSATSGLYDDAEIEDIQNIEGKLLEFLESQHPDIINEIKNTKDFSDETKERLNNALNEFKEAHKELFKLAR